VSCSAWRWLGRTSVLESMLTNHWSGAGRANRGWSSSRLYPHRTDGRRISLADFGGQPLVINFWASYCPPCRRRCRCLPAARERRQACAPRAHQRRRHQSGRTRLLSSTAYSRPRCRSEPERRASLWLVPPSNHCLVRADGSIAGARWASWTPGLAAWLATFDHSVDSGCQGGSLSPARGVAALFAYLQIALGASFGFQDRARMSRLAAVQWRPYPPADGPRDHRVLASGGRARRTGVLIIATVVMAWVV